jgi:hypothetical protein
MTTSPEPLDYLLILLLGLYYFFVVLKVVSYRDRKAAAAKALAAPKVGQKIWVLRHMGAAPQRSDVLVAERTAAGDRVGYIGSQGELHPAPSPYLLGAPLTASIT